MEHQDKRYQKIEKAIAFIVANYRQQPTLGTIAAAIQLSPGHTQRLFQQWAGLSPKAFVQFLTRQACLQRLKAGEDVLSTSLAEGLSSPSRLHDMCLHWDAMTPGDCRRQGNKLTLDYSWQDTEAGSALLATSQRGLCYLGFCPKGKDLHSLSQRWPQAILSHTPVNKGHADIAQQLFRPHPTLNLHIIGSPFQHKVWEALLCTPSGYLTCYGQLAKAIGQTNASRAVGTAVGNNPLAVLIPCHRVIRADGNIGQYHWGSERKAGLLLREAAELPSS